MAHDTFATVINCMDGRVQEPVLRFMQQQCRVAYADMITEPGAIKFLHEGTDAAVLESIRRRAALSVELRRSKTLAIVAHHDCGGNPVGKEIQIEQLKSSIERAASWNLGVEIMGLWVDERWRASRVL